MTVDFRARLVSASLAIILAVVLQADNNAFNAAYRLDMRLLDVWQRIAPPDEPTGEVVVVGIDSAAIKEKGRWPWSRLDLAELIQLVQSAGPKSITLDVLLTEPGPYAPVSLMRAFRSRGVEAIDLLKRNPDEELADTIAASPVVIGMVTSVKVV